MRSALTCEKCKGGRLWSVPMNERSHQGAITPMAVAWSGTRSYGRLETVICDAGGFTVWYAQGFQPDRDLRPPKVPGDRPPCVECLNKGFWYIDPIKEQDGPGEPTPLGDSDAPFSACVCKGCGRLRWKVKALDGADRAEREPCHHCQGRERWLIQSVTDRAGQWSGDLQVLLRGSALWSGAKAVGKLTAEACLGCHEVEWLAQDYQGLSANGATLLERPLTVGGGPYR